jgi:hypothetical protein
MVELPFEVKALVSASFEKKFGNLKRKPGSDADGGGLVKQPPFIGKGSPGGPKKPKLDGNDPQAGVAKDPNKHNSKVPRDWKVEPNVFRKIVTPKVSELPKQDGKSICALFHILGKCSRGKSCPHSHNDLSSETKDALSTFILARKEEHGLL